MVIDRAIIPGGFVRKAQKKTMTPFEILKAIKNLTEEEKETLAILADKGLSEELLKRRKDVIVEMQKGELRTFCTNAPLDHMFCKFTHGHGAQNENL